jgi:hypothetical protein
MAKTEQGTESKGARRERAALHRHLHGAIWQIPTVTTITSIAALATAASLPSAPAVALGILLVGTLVAGGACCALLGVRLRAAALARPSTPDEARSDALASLSGFLLHLAVGVATTVLFATLVGSLAERVFVAGGDGTVGVAVALTVFVIGAAGVVLYLLALEKRLKGTRETLD